MYKYDFLIKFMNLARIERIYYTLRATNYNTGHAYF